MQLLTAAASPFARKVRVLIREAGITDVEEVDVQTTPLASDPLVLAANPTGKIPVLVRSAGPAIYDSRVICRFLDDHAKAGLYPEGRLWEVLTLEATADAIMDAAVGITYEMRFRSEADQSQEWLNAQWGKIERAIGAVEVLWMPLLAGPLNIGQIAVGCALEYLDFRHDKREWHAGHKVLADWQAAFSTRPNMVATQPA